MQSRIFLSLSSWKALSSMWIVGTLLLGNPPAFAQGFSAYVSPPRFELVADPGAVLRQILNIEHVGLTPGTYRIYTNDWQYQSDNSIAFSDALTANSCRPWVTLERRELTVAPHSRYRFRFEIAPPVDTKPVECRFALMVEGVESVQLEQGAMQLPVGGRIAVMVYASIAGAGAHLEFIAEKIVNVRGALLPAVEVQNTGLAHGRLYGLLETTLPSGKRVDLSPSDGPILPGETRTIILEPQWAEGETATPLQYPLTVTGQLEWGKNRIEYQKQFVAP